MKIKHNLYISFLLLTIMGFSLHDYFVATYQANLSKDGKSIQIAAKFIAHDVENALIESNHPNLKLGSKNEYVQKDSILNEYLKTKLIFTINGKETPFKILGSEVELDEDFWVYIEVPLSETPKSIKVYNAILTEVFKGQQNIMHWDLEGHKKSLIFTHLNNEQEIKL